MRHDLLPLPSYGIIPPHLGRAFLKEAAREVIPWEVIARPKGYFPVPALKYIEGPFLAHIKDVMSQPSAKARGLFNEAYVKKLYEAPEEHITPLRGSKLYQIALLEMWLQTHVDQHG